LGLITSDLPQIFHFKPDRGLFNHEVSVPYPEPSCVSTLSPVVSLPRGATQKEKNIEDRIEKRKEEKHTAQCRR
jgi:hypothetical protein